MNRSASILLTIIITASLTGGAVYFYLNSTNNAEEKVADVVQEEDAEKINEETVSHYSDEYINFDYPGDLKILVWHFGEGSQGETISFLQSADGYETFEKVGPDITITNEGGGKEEYITSVFEKAKNSDSEEINLGGLEAYVNSLHEDFGGEDYKEVHFLTYRNADDGKTLYYNGYAVPESVFLLGDKYDEIIEMFITTASH